MKGNRILIGNSSQRFQTEFQFASCKSISKDRSYLLWGSLMNEIRVYNLEKQIEETALIGHTKTIEKVIITQDNQNVISCADDGSIKIWDFNTKKIIGNLLGHLGWVKDISICSEKKFLVSGSNDRTLRVWDLEKMTEKMCFAGLKHPVSSVGISAKRKIIASIDWRLTEVQVWI